MTKYEVVSLIGSTLGFIAFVLAWYWYDWRLAVIIFLVQWAANIEAACRAHQKKPSRYL